MILDNAQQDAANRFAVKTEHLKLKLTEANKWYPYLEARTKKNKDVCFRLHLAGYNKNLDCVYLYASTNFTGRYAGQHTFTLVEFEQLDPAAVADLITQIKTSRDAIRAANKAVVELKKVEFDTLKDKLARL